MPAKKRKLLPPQLPDKLATFNADDWPNPDGRKEWDPDSAARGRWASATLTWIFDNGMAGEYVELVCECLGTPS